MTDLHPTCGCMELWHFIFSRFECVAAVDNCVSWFLSRSCTLWYQLKCDDFIWLER